MLHCNPNSQYATMVRHTHTYTYIHTYILTYIHTYILIYIHTLADLKYAFFNRTGRKT